VRTRRGSDGSVVLSLPWIETMALRSLPDRLRHLLADPGSNAAVIRRLFPRAHADEEEEAEYRRLVGDELLRRRQDSIDAIEEALAEGEAHRTHLDVTIPPERYELWLGFVNDMRLILGTELDIRDEDWERDLPPDDPRAPDIALFQFLGWLEHNLLEASGVPMPDLSPEDIHRKE